ncbi:hypothetical protein C8R44DRAFT_744448 [Mycena epipterygia]|nr:hypothetical protein C8R44DRAFT_744448 [Mycena epipterygia]
MVIAPCGSGRIRGRPDVVAEKPETQSESGNPHEAVPGARIRAPTREWTVEINRWFIVNSTIIQATSPTIRAIKSNWVTTRGFRWRRQVPARHRSRRWGGDGASVDALAGIASRGCDCDESMTGVVEKGGLRGFIHVFLGQQAGGLGQSIRRRIVRGYPAGTRGVGPTASS